MDTYLYNQSLHQDFHIGFNDIIRYLRDRYGKKVLKEIMISSAKKVYSPLIEEMKSEGLKALKNHFTRIMELEDGRAAFEESSEGPEELVVNVIKDPVITYLIEKGVSPDEDFLEITAEVMQDTIAEECAYTHSAVFDKDFVQFLNDFRSGKAAALPELPLMYSHHWRRGK